MCCCAAKIPAFSSKAHMQVCLTLEVSTRRIGGSSCSVLEDILSAGLGRSNSVSGEQKKPGKQTRSKAAAVDTAAGPAVWLREHTNRQTNETKRNSQP